MSTKKKAKRKIGNKVPRGMAWARDVLVDEADRMRAKAEARVIASEKQIRKLKQSLRASVARALELEATADVADAVHQLSDDFADEFRVARPMLDELREAVAKAWARAGRKEPEGGQLGAVRMVGALGEWAGAALEEREKPTALLRRLIEAVGIVDGEPFDAAVERIEAMKAELDAVHADLGSARAELEAERAYADKPHPFVLMAGMANTCFICGMAPINERHAHPQR